MIERDTIFLTLVIFFAGFLVRVDKGENILLFMAIISLIGFTFYPESSRKNKMKGGKK